MFMHSRDETCDIRYCKKKRRRNMQQQSCTLALHKDEERYARRYVFHQFKTWYVAQLFRALILALLEVTPLTKSLTNLQMFPCFPAYVKSLSWRTAIKMSFKISHSPLINFFICFYLANSPTLRDIQFTIKNDKENH